jgi:uncharacterized membrane protein (UPF0127 family)
VPSSHFLQPLLKKTDLRLGLFVSGRPDPIATVLETAFDSATRRKGLLGRNGLASSTALIIAPCGLVHTFGMRFPIGTVFAGRDGTILKVLDHLARNRLAGAVGAFATIEVAAGLVTDHGLTRGDRLELRRLD